CGTMVVELLAACPHLTILATSREPLGVPGELSWRVPSLPLADEAILLFGDRARRARPEFVVGEDNSALVTETCERLDGMPLAIELAAARVRALSLSQIIESLHDRFRLLTGGARTAVRRQQTLRASLDWSHALLTEPEQCLFRRLAAFANGFDLGAAQAVGASSEVELYQLMDQLGLLVDKSLVVAEDTGTGMRYRLLETVRQYAQEKLGESGEADEVRTRHRDYYTAMAAELESRGHARDDELLEWAQTEIDNLRVAFAWSQENSDLATALQLIESLRPLWLRGGRVKEALVGLDAVLADESHSQMPPAVWVGVVTLRAILAAWVGVSMDVDRTQQALAIARQLDDPPLITRALIACGRLAYYGDEDAGSYFAEATDLAQASGDRWNLCQIFGYQASAAFIAGEPIAACAAAEEGRDLADALGDRFFSRNCRAWLALALLMRGDSTHASQVSHALAVEAEAAGDLTMKVYGHICRGSVHAFQGDAAAAYEAAQSALNAAEAVGGFLEDSVYGVFANAALAAGDAPAALRAAQHAWQHTNPLRESFTMQVTPMNEAALACGDLADACRWADDTVAAVSGWYRMRALTVRAFIAIAQGDPQQAERDAHDALELAARTQGYLRVADTLECLVRLAVDANHQYAARLLGAAEAMRQRMNQPRYPMYQNGYDAAVTAVREALGQKDFDAAWVEGAALSTEEAIAYAQRGRGERKRPTSGWASLTPMEHDVVRLVAEGLGNKDIGARLFVSPRTVQTHLTHVYAKLALTSRVQLVQEAGRQNLTVSPITLRRRRIHE
ncbi:MAG TPA: LuxR C-terminal-related transcriptional regulator, partial [Mycobacterium sp.]|nr:LuxR C-terminal-related transcriptional regulator [Mycobacterium sp.]